MLIQLYGILEAHVVYGAVKMYLELQQLVDQQKQPAIIICLFFFFKRRNFVGFCTNICFFYILFSNI